MIKKKIYFYIDNIQGLNLDYVKQTKASLILRNKINNTFDGYEKFVNECKKRRINVYVSNNINLLFKLKTNRFYISAYNKKQYKWLKKTNNKIKIIGSAHNRKEILEKKEQGCKKIILSRLFKTSKLDYLNTVKFNLIKLKINYKYIALGGIKETNFKKLKMVNCADFATMSELKKYPKYLKG